MPIRFLVALDGTACRRPWFQARKTPKRPRFSRLFAPFAPGVDQLRVVILGVNHSWGFIGRSTLAATAMAGALLGIEALSGPRWSDPSLSARLLNTGVLLGVAGAGAVAFFVVLRMLGGLSAEDRRRLLASKLPLKGVWRRVL